MITGGNNKLANVPTITGLSNVDADVVTSTTVDTDTLTLNGVDVGAQIAQIPINTAAIAGLQQITTGQSYASVGDTTTFDNNVTLTPGNTMTADNFNGLASSASQVLVTDINDANTYHPIFASTGTGQKSLLFDITTTPLSYVPSTSTLSATNFTAGTNVTTPNILSLTSITPSNARSILLNGTPIGNGGNVNTVCMGLNAGNASMPNNNFCFGTNSGLNLSTAGGFGSGVQNLCIGANSGNLLTYGRNNVFLGGSAARFTTTGTYNTQVGSQSQTYPDNNITGSFNTTIGADSYIAVDGLSYSTAIGAKVVASFSNTIQIGRNVDNTIFDGTVTLNNDLILDTVGYTLTPTVLSYLDGATSNIQAQINAFPAAANTVTTNTTQTITADKTFTGTTINTGTTWFNNDFLVSINALGTDTTLRLTTQGAQTFIQGGATSTTGTADIVFSSIYSSIPWVTMNNLGMKIAANNITLGGGNINFGSGAGSTSNLICGNTSAKSIVFSTGANTVYGSSAGNAMSIAAASNTYIGSSAAVNATSSVQNVCLGANAGAGITSGLGANIFIGYLSGFQTANGTGSNNVCIGSQSGTAMTTTAASNVMVGAICGLAVTTGVRNTLIGAGAADSLNSGNDNTVVGQGAGTMILTGLRNTIVGASSGNTITGSDNIVIGSSADVPTAAGNNQIAIGTVTETMFIRGAFNWRVGPQIVSTSTGTLNAANFRLAQFYIVNMSTTGQTITLPNPTTAAYLGATVTFKRKGVTTPFTLTSGGGISFVPIGSITLSASPHTVAATVFQVTLIADGSNWCIINQA